MKVARNIVDTLMTRQEEIELEMQGDYRWDDRNSFSFDNQGFVQWYSDHECGDKIHASETMIEKLNKRGFKVYNRDGYISL